jgi:methyl-accepting chemotaxis protein
MQEELKLQRRTRLGTKALLVGYILVLALAAIIASIVSMNHHSPLLTAGGLLFLGVGSWLTVNWVVIRPLNDLLASARAIAGGDLNGLTPGVRRLAQTRQDEFGDLSRAFVSLADYYIEKFTWYEAILDSLPFPLSVTDNAMNWTFINRATEKVLNAKRADITGRPCSQWKADICKTENCGIARLRRNLLQTRFDQWGANFQVDTAYLLDSKGERSGHIEIVQDITRHVAVSDYQNRAVEQLSGCLRRLSQGDMAFEVLELPQADGHTQEVRENFQKVNANQDEARRLLAEAIRAVAERAVEVERASGQLAQAANQAGQATSQIAVTVQEVAKGISHQSEAVTHTSTVLEGVSQSIQGVAKGAQEQAKAIGAAAQITQKITSQGGLSNRFSLSAQKVQEMGARSQQIGQIVETIEEIASQTNLLALNAAIEAARAGEHGKGFAVVADEVRKLAERSAAATKEISALIKGIQKNVHEAVEITTLAAQEIGAVSQELAVSIEQVSAVVEENAAATDQMAAGAGEIVEAIDSIAGVSEENSAAIEEVSASAEEMTAQVEEVSASAQSLSEMAHVLQELVERFKLDQNLKLKSDQGLVVRK